MEEVEGVKNLENASVQDAKLLLFIRYDYDVITALIKDDMLSDSVNHYNFVDGGRTCLENICYYIYWHLKNVITSLKTIQSYNVYCCGVYKLYQLPLYCKVPCKAGLPKSYTSSIREQQCIPTFSKFVSKWHYWCIIVPTKK